MTRSTPSTLPEVALLADGQRDVVATAWHDVAVIADRLDAEALALLRHLGRRQVVESLASLGALCAEPRLLPARRRFLDTRLADRRRAAVAALAHVDARLAMIDLGHLDEVVGHDTATVLHGMLESSDVGAVHSNAGLIRATPVAYVDDGSHFTPPPGDACHELVAAMTLGVGEALRAGRDPLEVATWVAACVFSIHPFVDGNGRTARSLFQLVHSAGASRFDWVSIEMWGLDRGRYIDSLANMTNPSAGGWFPDRIDVGQFLAFTVESFRHGVSLWLGRARWCGAAVVHPRLADLEAVSRFVALAVAIDRNVGRQEVEDMVDASIAGDVLESLVASGLLTRSALGLQPTAALLAICDEAVTISRT